ncbi:MAG: hypothetical protein ACU84Q_16005 [Gammaproteobacteria bacterium]
MPTTLIKNLGFPLVLLAINVNANAALSGWGALARTSVADCPSFCTNFNFGSTQGGMNFATSGISDVSEGRGSARASAALSGNNSAPILKAEAFANPSFRGAFGTAFAVQGYTYNGLGETLTIDVELDGLVNDPELDASDTNARLEVVLYTVTNFDFISDRGTLDFESGAAPLLQPNASEASVVLQLDHTNPTQDSGQISVDVATGDEFYLWAFLRAEAQSGAQGTSADAFNTGVISFAGNPDLIVAAPVPLPTAVWLFGGAVLVLIRQFSA